METFEIGETVKLNGNNTTMVVEVTYDNNAVCVWHDKNALLHREVFNKNMLHIVPFDFDN